MAIEKIINFKVPRNAEIVRNIVLGANTIVSHATHFYFMWGPDLVNDVYKDQKLYAEIKKKFDPLKSEHLRAVLTEARIPLHSVVATFGGKFPHPMHAVPGGVCSIPKYIELIKVNTMLREVKGFIEKDILNGVTLEQWAQIKTVKDLLKLMENPAFADSDVGLFVRYAQDIGLQKYGESTFNRFISFGFGWNKDGSMLYKPGYLDNGKYSEIDPALITEDTSHSYYENEAQARNPQQGLTKPAPKKQGAYSWIKAPRYSGNAVEAGPLAKLLVAGDPFITDLVKTFGVNTFTRTVARVHDILVILPKLIEWLDEIDLQKPFYTPFPRIKEGSGYAMVEAPRGALSHWINVKDGKVTTYQIITPTTWNCSPVDSKGQHSSVEQALIGAQLRSKDSVIEAAHIVRSFDPCISCSIHAIGQEKNSIKLQPGV